MAQHKTYLDGLREASSIAANIAETYMTDANKMKPGTTRLMCSSLYAGAARCSESIDALIVLVKNEQA